VPIQAACIGRRCDVDSGTPFDAGTPPADAGSDAAPDAGIEAGSDGGDGGGCTSPLGGPYNFHWPFDEGPASSQVIEEKSKVASALTGMLSIGGPCGGMLVLTGGKSQTLFGTQTWMLPKFGVGFWLYFLGGTGTVLSRGASNVGGFEITITAQAAMFTVHGPIGSTTAGVNPPPLSQWVRVYAASTGAGVTFSLDNASSLPASPVAAFVTSASDVVVGGGTLAIAIADLYLGPP
jgi:type IV secretory pathway TrbD component